MRSFRSGRPDWSADLGKGGSVQTVALHALRRATRLLGLAIGAALGRLRESGATAARLFARADDGALLLRMAREAAEILGTLRDKVPERHNDPRRLLSVSQRFLELVDESVMQLVPALNDDDKATAVLKEGFPRSSEASRCGWVPARCSEADGRSYLVEIQG